MSALGRAASGRAVIVLLNGLGLLGLLLVATNVFLYLQNRSAQAEVNARAQFLQQSAQLEVLYRNIVKALAEQSVKSNDPQLMGILSSQGISVSVNQPTTTPVPAPAALPAKR